MHLPKLQNIRLFALLSLLCALCAGCERNTVSDPASVQTIGVFSVSSDKQVSFCKGNLQYTQSTARWSFAANQYDLLGTDNVCGEEVETDAVYGERKYGTALADRIDLFGWSSTGAAKWGAGVSTLNKDYAGDFVDWGTNIGDGKTFRTLSCDEWNYLLSERTDAADLQDLACIRKSETDYVNGLVLLPDDWSCPKGIAFTGGFGAQYSVQAYADLQTYSPAEWQQLESAGAVFLPAVGYREGADAFGVQSGGNYWSATPRDANNVHYLLFYPLGARMAHTSRPTAHSVRLVKDL